MSKGFSETPFSTWILLRLKYYKDTLNYLLLLFAYPGKQRQNQWIQYRKTAREKHHIVKGILQSAKQANHCNKHKQIDPKHY